MIPQQKVLEALERFDIDQNQLEDWEEQLGVSVPVDAYGNKLYSSLHVNLFKNVKKHLTLGRSMMDIKRMVVLPAEPSEADVVTYDLDNMALEPTGRGRDYSASPYPQQQAQPKPQQPQIRPQHLAGPASVAEDDSNFTRPMQDLRREITPPQTPVEPRTTTLSGRLKESLESSFPTHFAYVGPDEKASRTPTPVESTPAPQELHPSGQKPYASTTVTKTTQESLKTPPSANSALFTLIDRLIEEKDSLQSKSVIVEKQKAHLYQANELFQKRVKELTDELERLRSPLSDKESLKLFDEKARLQKQVIDAEQRTSDMEKRLMKQNSEIAQLKDTLAETIHAKVIIGNWLEEADLLEVEFDNFGINIEEKRNRMFKITNPPDRFFGHTGIIETHYDYQTNTEWKRTETLIVSILNHSHLQGELVVEFHLQGTPVARARYSVHCYRNGVKPQ